MYKYAAEGGDVLIKVEFSNRTECEKIYQWIMTHIEKGNYQSSFDVTIKKIGKRQLYIQFRRDEVTFQFVVKPMLSRVFTDYILLTHELLWLHDKLENQFFYYDEEERDAIVSLFYLIIDGKRDDIPNANGIPSRQHLIEDAVKSLLQEGFQEELSFSFDSFLKFRLKEYQKFLFTYMAMAIDEYKLEQDYQNFIQNLRSFLDKKQATINTLHVVYEEQAFFFDEQLKLIHEDKIASVVKQSGYFFEHTPIEPTLLQPLLTLAPNEVYVYADEDQTGLLYTLQNIFQERLTIRSISEWKNTSQSSM